jgi:ubiquinone/menaquinone biosynthesis C-methylase UbiE
LKLEVFALLDTLVATDRQQLMGAYMTTDYDAIADRYKRAKQQPWRSFIESFTLMNLIDDLTGKSVVDLACGVGFYTRLLRLRGGNEGRRRRSLGGDD